MRLLVSMLVLALTGHAFALDRHLCASANLVKLRGAPLRLATTFSLPPGFDPAADGLTLDVALEPEADPANTLYSVTLPASGFTAKPFGWLYEDRTAAVGSVRKVRISRARQGLYKMRFITKGLGLVGFFQPRRIRVAMATDATTCLRTCSAVYANQRARKSDDTAMCGVMSGCELLNLADGQTTGGQCLLPYPSNLFTKADGSTTTGLRLAYPGRALPANGSGVHIDPARWNKLDGFSPGTIATAWWPQGVDLTASNVPPNTNWAASVAPSSNTILIEADSPGCNRVEHFGENDVSLSTDNLTPLAPPNQVFMIRPGRRLQNATRYVVAMRNFVGQDSQPIQPGDGFRALRDGTPSGNAALEARRPAMDAILNKLVTDCGWSRSSVLLAWDFTTASDDSIQRYLLHMRDESFAALPGSAAPAFVVNTVTENPNPGQICRRIEGTFTAPLWTTFNGTGSVLNIDPDTDLPVQNGVAADVPFSAIIPCSLTAPPTAGRAIFYGHGLLGSGSGEVAAGNLRNLAQNHGFVIAATDWQGFSNADLGTVIGFIGELSGFPKLSERLHQGVLNQLLLARLLSSPNGFASHPAFQYSGTPVIDNSQVFYYGNSQGGIEGGVVMAIAQEVTRGVLGVPAANYSTLLHRSRDFDSYFALLRVGYPNDIARNLTLPIIQQLWDRSEPNGWYHQTIPGSVPNTPPHDVLVLMALSDDEVSNLGTEIMVRSMGMPHVSPVNRSYYLIPEQPAPFSGSAMFTSDFGEPDPPTTNIPPADNGVHGAMRGLPEIQSTISAFLQTGGNVQNFCSGGLCNPN